VLLEQSFSNLNALGLQLDAMNEAGSRLGELQRNETFRASQIERRCAAAGTVDRYACELTDKLRR